MNESRIPAAALLTDLIDNLASFATGQLGLSPSKSKEFAQDAAAFLADHWGGQNVYIPKDMAGRICSRDARIYSDFNGANADELARKYGLSYQHIHRIIKKEREKRSVKQHGLPLS
ncbi:Mor transcription activator family protein [Pseudodesulfovibrio senegalensis]|uniref:DNA-binding protein n=1 Tax=Pseudodesulfovibrio senegalensis TaxID=1721087 RepID=A0A6N6MZJ7_9BACT|nr:Mor transcription activator family protein [Pseudodesulfovibrio senegalensis]KAB1440358.1 DNA-binding protein [Pseudodesulfovibrio senegalensis]